MKNRQNNTNQSNRRSARKPARRHRLARCRDLYTGLATVQRLGSTTGLVADHLTDIVLGTGAGQLLLDHAGVTWAGAMVGAVSVAVVLWRWAVKESTLVPHLRGGLIAHYRLAARLLRRM